jgi:hypothetical protein
VSVSEHMFLCVRSFIYILDITLWTEPKVTRRFHKFKQLDGKGPCLLVRTSPELVPGSFWPMAGYQKVTTAVHLAEIYNGDMLPWVLTIMFIQRYTIEQRLEPKSYMTQRLAVLALFLVV